MAATFVAGNTAGGAIVFAVTPWDLGVVAWEGLFGDCRTDVPFADDVASRPFVAFLAGGAVANAAAFEGEALAPVDVAARARVDGAPCDAALPGRAEVAPACAAA